MDWSWLIAVVITIVVSLLVARLVLEILAGHTTAIAAQLAGLILGVVVFLVLFGPVHRFIESFDEPDIDIPRVSVDTNSREDTGTCTAEFLGRTFTAQTTRDECDDANGTFEVSSARANPTTTERVSTQQPEPTATANERARATSTLEPAQTGDNRDLDVTVAGRDFFAIGVADENSDVNYEGLDGGWMRITEAGNLDFCAWASKFKLEISSGVSAQIPHCLEWRLAGTGDVRVTFLPDSIGYHTSDTLGTGLAWWPSGHNGEYRVFRNGDMVTDFVPLTTGPEGVNFPRDGGEVTIEFRISDGYVQMPLGEIRNNVMPKY